MLKVFEAFSGYGSQSIALRNIGIDYEVVAISEIDKYAIKAYEAIHGKSNNLGDISKIKVEDIPEHDLFTYSFPCTDISVAGKQEGIVRGTTRSGLLYECERIIEHCKPKYLLLENVKNLVGKKFKSQFDGWLQYLESLGYTNYWQVLNAKNYGVPQNRERVFVVSVLGEHKPYEFPKPIKLDKAIKDILEDKVDEKYYLSDEYLKRFKKSIGNNKMPNSNRYTVLGTTVGTGEGTNSRHWVYDVNDSMSTLSATDYKQPKQIAEINQVGMLNIKGNEQIRRVYGDNGISPTLNTMQGGNRQPKTLCEKITQYVEVRKHEVNIPNLQKCLKEHKLESKLTNSQIADVLLISKTTVDHWFRTDKSFSIPSKEIWKELKTLLNIGTKEFDESIMEFEIKENEYDTSNRAYRVDGIAPTLTCDNESTAKKIICEARTDEGLRFFKNNICGTIRAIYSGGDKRVIEIPQATKKGYIEMEVPGVCDLSYPNSKTRRGRVQEGGQVSPTLTATTQDICYIDGVELPCIGASRGRNPNNPSSRTVGEPTEQRLEINKNGTSNTITTVQKDNYAIEQSFRIRKLTPRECFRLMGMRDSDIDKIQQAGISNSQQYKMAGNSIVVNVLEGIFKKLFRE